MRSVFTITLEGMGYLSRAMRCIRGRAQGSAAAAYLFLLLVLVFWALCWAGPWGPALSADETESADRTVKIGASL